MKSLLSVVLLVLAINPGQPLSYPIYGTKRYHRTAASSPSLMPSSQSYPYQLNTYYDNQPILSSSSGSSTGSSANQLSSYGSLPYSMTNYPVTNNNGYLSDPNVNNYYYYPHHEFNTYGMPTYRGEYKPKPYYYAPAPRYSYFDDREITSNPLDDLHEEMLHEDERDQHRQVLQDEPAFFGKESWYQTGAGRQEELTNNFLRNLIAYNRQLEQQERERQLSEQAVDNNDYMQKDQYAIYNNEPEPEYDEYTEVSDYEYEQPQPVEHTSVLERKKFEKMQENQQQKFLHEQKQRQQYQNRLNEVDDEDVRQLKNLAKFSKHKDESFLASPIEEEQHKPVKPNLPSQYNFNSPSNQKDQKPLKPENYVNSVLKSNANYDYKPQTKTMEPVSDSLEPLDGSDEWYTPQQSSDSNSEKSSLTFASQYTDEPEEYYEDDSAWISWDRKRSNDRTNVNFDQETPVNSKNVVDLIKAFNDRKPQNLNKISSEQAANTSSSTAPKNDTTTILPALMKNKILGQKEVVLPRPATITKHIFTAPLLNIINGNSKQFLDESQSTTPEPSNILHYKNNPHANQANRNSEAIYKTIKQLISMENDLDKNSKIRKRFVSNEESLVKELDRLKQQKIL